MRRMDQIEKGMNYFRDAVLDQDRKIRSLKKRIDELSDRIGSTQIEPIIISCCREMDMAIRKGVVTLGWHNSYERTLLRHVLKKGTERRTIFFCPFCGERLKTMERT